MYLRISLSVPFVGAPEVFLCYLMLKWYVATNVRNEESVYLMCSCRGGKYTYIGVEVRLFVVKNFLILEINY